MSLCPLFFSIQIRKGNYLTQLFGFCVKTFFVLTITQSVWEGKFRESIWFCTFLFFAHAFSLPFHFTFFLCMEIEFSNIHRPITEKGGNHQPIIGGPARFKFCLLSVVLSHVDSTNPCKTDLVPRQPRWSNQSFNFIVDSKCNYRLSSGPHSARITLQWKLGDKLYFSNHSLLVLSILK